MSVLLSEKLRAFNDTLSGAEQANYKLLLGLAAGGLAPDLEKLPDAADSDGPTDGGLGEAFDTVTETLAQLQPYRDRIKSNGIAYRGRPGFMTDKLLASLQAEAVMVRRGASRFDEHFLGCGGPLADKLATSDTLATFVRTHAGDVRATGVASFLFYDEPGQGIDPHIDTDVFSLNVLLMLRHSQEDPERGSALVVFPPRGQPERLELEPGEIVVMFAGSVAHARERMRNGESVCILTFGFHPLGE